MRFLNFVLHKSMALGPRLPPPQTPPKKFEFGHDFLEIFATVDSLSGFGNPESEKIILK